jgi:hypothetical protein
LVHAVLNVLYRRIREHVRNAETLIKTAHFFIEDNHTINYLIYFKYNYFHIIYRQEKNMNTLIEHVQELTEKYHFVCVPLTNGKKYPNMAGWQKLTATPSIDKFEGCEGFGIITGKASGVFVFDIDNVENWEKIKLILSDEDLSEIEETAQVLTGSGGIHYYFKYDEEIYTTTNTIRIITKENKYIDSGFDIRADGGQVVAPNSLYNGTKEKKNTHYKWLNKPDELKNCPNWLKRLINNKDYILQDEKCQYEILEKKKDEKSEAKRNAKESKANEPNEESEEENKMINDFSENLTYGEFLDIAHHLNYDRFSDFENWRSLVFIFSRFDDMTYEEKEADELHNKKLIDLDAICQKCPKYRDGTFKDIEKMYVGGIQHVDEENKYTNKTLLYWLKYDNLAYFKTFIRNKENKLLNTKNKFDHNDDYSWGHLRHELISKTWDSYENLLLHIRKNSPRVLAKILTGKGTYYQKDGAGRISHIDRRAFDGDFNLRYITFKEDKRSKSIKQKEETTTFTKIIKDGDILKEYRYADIFPNEAVEPCPDDVFNLWQGFQAQEVETVDMAKIQPFIDVLFNAWANKDNKKFRHLLAWFAFPLQNAGERTDTALFLYSAQGCGKNTITDFFVKFIYGPNLATDFHSFEEFNEKHDISKAGMAFAYIDEMGTTRENHIPSWEKMKTTITSATMNINPKGMMPYKIRNMMNLLLNTNNRDSLYIMSDDRRYNCIEISEIYRGNAEFWDNLYNNHFNQDTANHFFTYLRRLNLKEYPNPRLIMKTELREELLKTSQNNIFHFYDDLILSDWTKNNGYDKLKNGFYSADLYEQYKHYTNINGFKHVASSHKFGSTIKTKLQSIRTKNGIFYIMPENKKENTEQEADI